MRNNGAIYWSHSNTQKETSPLAHSVRNSLPHKSHRFCSPMRNNGAIYWSQLLVSHITCLASLAMQCETPKAYAMNLIRYKEPSIYSRPRIWIRSLRSLFTFASLTPYARFARYPNSLPAKARMRGRQIPSPCSTSYSFASLALTSSALPDLPAPRLEPYIGIQLSITLGFSTN